MFYSLSCSRTRLPSSISLSLSFSRSLKHNVFSLTSSVFLCLFFFYISLFIRLILMFSPSYSNYPSQPPPFYYSTSCITGSYPGFKIDVERELAYYASIRDEILEMTLDTIQYSNQALKDGKSILIEGANATSTDLLFDLDFTVLDVLNFILCAYVCACVCMSV